MCSSLQWLAGEGWRGPSAGGGYSTAEDLLKFARALQNHNLLSMEMTDMLWAGKVLTGRGPEDRYGYGFGEKRVRSSRVVWHNGGAPGINAFMEMYVDAAYAVIVLANLDPPAAGRVADFIAQRIPL